MQEDSKKFVMRAWDQSNVPRFTTPEEINGDFLAALQRLLTQAEAYADKYQSLRNRSKKR